MDEATGSDVRAAAAVHSTDDQTRLHAGGDETGLVTDDGGVRHVAEGAGPGGEPMAPGPVQPDQAEGEREDERSTGEAGVPAPAQPDQAEGERDSSLS
jgi:hypothetical protein